MYKTTLYLILIDFIILHITIYMYINVLDNYEKRSVYLIKDGMMYTILKNNL